MTTLIIFKIKNKTDVIARLSEAIFRFDNQWRGSLYRVKQVEVYAVKEADDFLVITVISKYF